MDGSTFLELGIRGLDCDLLAGMCEEVVAHLRLGSSVIVAKAIAVKI